MLIDRRGKKNFYILYPTIFSLNSIIRFGSLLIINYWFIIKNAENFQPLKLDQIAARTM